MDAVEDIWGKFVAGILRASPEKKADNAEKLLGAGGDVKLLLDKLEEAVVAPRFIGARMTAADVFIYCAFGQWASGFFQGVTIEKLIGNRSKLAGVIKGVAGMPKVKEYYAKKDLSKKENA